MRVGSVTKALVIPQVSPPNSFGNVQNVEGMMPVQENESPEEVKELKKSGKVECETCKNRQYVDQSGDAGVSFKAPGHISPESSAAVVSAHEGEHVAIAKAEGAKPGAKLVSASVTLHTSICPECGRAYVSGGETQTQIEYSKPTDKKGGVKSVDEDIKGAKFDQGA